MGLGGPTEAPVVTNDSPVGRPEFIPSLEPITLGAAWPNGHEPMLAVAGGRLWVIRRSPSSAQRSHSQQSQFYDAYLGVDDTSATTWLREVPPLAAEIGKRPAPRCRHRGPVPHAGMARSRRRKRARGMTIDAATGSFGRPLAAAGHHGDRLFLGLLGCRRGRQRRLPDPHGRLFRFRHDAMASPFGPSRERESPRMAPGHASDAPSPGRATISFRGVSTSDGSPTNKVASYAYADGKGRTITAPFPIDLSQCVSNGFTVWVCTGRTSDGTEAITAFDEASGKVLWHWKTGDPEATTGVAREVPQQIRAWGLRLRHQWPGRATSRHGDRQGTRAWRRTSTEVQRVWRISVSGNTITWQQPTS